VPPSRLRYGAAAVMFCSAVISLRAIEKLLRTLAVVGVA
jgi:hypothetical protein